MSRAQYVRCTHKSTTSRTGNYVAVYQSEMITHVRLVELPASSGHIKSCDIQTVRIKKIEYIYPITNGKQRERYINI